MTRRGDPRHHTPRRPLQVAVLAALLGFLTTVLLVLVAVGIAMRWGVTLVDIQPPNARWIWPPPQGWLDKPVRAREERSFGYRDCWVTSVKDAFERPDRARNGMQRIFEAGLPFTATAYRSSSDTQDASPFPPGNQFLRFSNDGGAVLLQPQYSSLSYRNSAVVLPLTPWWPGLLGNVAVWSAAWYALLVVPGAIRRRVRASAGRCVACNYTLAGLATCPECGALAGSARTLAK